MGIIHTAKKHIKDEILRKRRMELLREKERFNSGNANINTREDLQVNFLIFNFTRLNISKFMFLFLYKNEILNTFSYN
jgi:hypothetical protein